ncbi:hypothetical protein B0H13DRAFT_1875918 [Mycena leptocephala]|nr:hypothetical protein B0H13DRAFT_1875918 [Mycena leptocephala]
MNLLTVPADELSDDEEDSDDEDETPTKRKEIPYSSPLSDVPRTPSPLFPFFEAALAPMPQSSSPMYTPRMQRKVINERIQIQRRETLENKKAAALAEKEQKKAAKGLQKEQEEQAKKDYLEKVLSGLQANNYSLADFMEYAAVKKVFGYRSSRKDTNITTRTVIWDWAFGLVQRTVSRESRQITLSGLLSKAKRTVNEEFFLTYSLRAISRTLRGMAPAAFGIFDAFSTTKR